MLQAYNEINHTRNNQQQKTYWQSFLMFKEGFVNLADVFYLLSGTVETKKKLLELESLCRVVY